MLPEDAPVRLTNAQLEELDYRKLYAAYSSRGRKSVTDPRVLFKILVYGYQCGIYTTRKLEEACQYRIDFKWLLWDEPVPDHSTISRFRTGRCAEAVEDLFYQYVRYLEEQGETDHETVFIDGTKLESRAGRYTFFWRKSVEKQLAKVKEKVLSAVSITSLKALEQHLAEMAAEITFVHGPGHRKSATQKESVYLGKAFLPLVGSTGAAKTIFHLFFRHTGQQIQACIVADAVDIKPFPPEHGFLLCCQQAPGKSGRQNCADRIGVLPVKRECDREASARTKQLPRFFQKHARLQEMLIGIEGHQHIIAGLFMSQEIPLLDMDARVKEQNFSFAASTIPPEISSPSISQAPPSSRSMNMEPLPQPISSTQAPPRGIEIAEATMRAGLDSEKSSSQNEATESKYSAISRVYSFAVVVPLYFHCMRIQPAVQAPRGDVLCGLLN